MMTMTNPWMVLLLCLALSGCTDKTIAIDPVGYDGDYPYYRNQDIQIRTYQPDFKNPDWTNLAPSLYAISFNEHTWNHWPYTRIGAGWRNGSDFGVSALAMEGRDCIKESFNFVVPAKVGMHRFGKEVAYAFTSPGYSTEDCDGGKDAIKADQTANNWVNITRFDSLSKPNEAEGNFDLTFKITRKNLTYSIVYPNTIRMRGSFKQRFKEK